MKNVQKTMRNYPKKKKEKHTPLFIFTFPNCHILMVKKKKKNLVLLYFFIDNKQGETYHPLSGFDC